MDTTAKSLKAFVGNGFVVVNIGKIGRSADVISRHWRNISFSLSIKQLVIYTSDEFTPQKAYDVYKHFNCEACEIKCTR